MLGSRVLLAQRLDQLERLVVGIARRLHLQALGSQRHKGVQSLGQFDLQRLHELL